MKNLPPMSDEYFKKFSDKPVLIKPYNPKSKQVAESSIGVLRSTLNGIKVDILHRGSTAFGISGKGDIEIGVYPSEADWFKVIELLKTKYGRPGNVDDDYVRFNASKDGFDVEIILQKGEAAIVDIALTKYLKTHAEHLREYEEVKNKYSYSKRAYQTQKDKFLRKVVDLIPE